MKRAGHRSGQRYTPLRCRDGDRGGPTLRPRPVADRRGLDRRRRASQLARPRPARRGARATRATGSPSTTRRRCSPAASPEILVAEIAASDEPHPGRQRRRDALALQPVQGGRAVQHPRRPPRRADRPRRRPRARTPTSRPSTRCSATAGRRSRTTSSSSSTSSSPTSATRAFAVLPAAGGGPRPVAARHLAGDRRLGGGARTPLLRRRFREPRRLPRAPASTASASAPRRRDTPARLRGRRRGLRRDAQRG